MFGNNGYNQNNRCNGGCNRSNESVQPTQSNRCNCKELFEGVTRDRFVRVYLKSSTVIEGFFLGVFGNIVTLYDSEDGCVSSKTICCEDVLAVSSFGQENQCNRNDDHGHHDHHGHGHRR